MNEFVIKDKFVDYAGNEHHFVIVAVKTPVKGSIVVTPHDDIAEPIGFVNMGLKIGVSICNPIDKFDEKIGVLKALARANGSEAVLYTAYPGQLGDSVIDTYLKQEAHYIKENPDKFIKGYSEAKERYLKLVELQNIKDKFTDMEKVIAESLKKDPTYLDNVYKYIEYWKKCNKCKN